MLTVLAQILNAISLGKKNVKEILFKEFNVALCSLE